MQKILKPLSYFLPIDKCGAEGWVKEDLEFYLSDPGYLDNDNKVLINDNILYPVPFSFSLISGGSTYHTHPFIIKVLWENNKERQHAWNGYIEGFGNYKYISSKLNPYTPTEKQLSTLKNFIIKFKVLLTACWWGKLFTGCLQDYFWGNLPFNGLIKEFEGLDKKYLKNLNNCMTIQELEEYVRDNKLWSLD